MSFVRVGDYPIVFRPDEVIGVDVFGGAGDSWVLRIHLRNSEPIKIVDSKAHIEDLFDDVIVELDDPKKAIEENNTKELRFIADVEDVLEEFKAFMKKLEEHEKNREVKS